ncbi:MAG: alkaline phosphatase PhoX [Rhodothermales bacterium]
MASRRSFLKRATAVSLGFTGLHTFLGCAPKGLTTIETPALIADPLKILSLPNGFSYKVISRAGDPMSDGFMVPARPDGMAAFDGGGNLTILVRNHETDIRPGTGAYGKKDVLFPNIDPSLLYDAGYGKTPSMGGTSTVVYDTVKQEVVREFLSLAGTLRNCAGGPTPWNTWITCEETTEKKSKVLEKDHGYNFEVPATLEPALTVPVPLKEMGRFNHEAIAIEPNSGIVYQTEDRHDGLIYRFIPNTPGQLARGGRLQALAVIDQPSFDTRNWEADAPTVVIGQKLAVRWMDMEEIDAPEDDLRIRGFEAGAARFARGEGMWHGDNTIFFACTNGGIAKKGQIWKYVPSPDEGTTAEANSPGYLELFVEPNDSEIVENADNLTVAPWGDLFVCEDGPGGQNLLRVNPAGEVIRFGSNMISDSEFAGSTFSPDGTTLFVNIQVDGLTLAITGPWNTFAS